jgi:hypothetical protein
MSSEFEIKYITQNSHYLVRIQCVIGKRKQINHPLVIGNVTIQIISRNSNDIGQVITILLSSKKIPVDQNKNKLGT